MPGGGDRWGLSWRLATPARFEGNHKSNQSNQPGSSYVRDTTGARDTTAWGKARDTARDLAELILVGKLGAKQPAYECYLREVVGVRVGMQQHTAPLASHLQTRTTGHQTDCVIIHAVTLYQPSFVAFSHVITLF